MKRIAVDTFNILITFILMAILGVKAVFVPILACCNPKYTNVWFMIFVSFMMTLVGAMVIYGYYLVAALTWALVIIASIKHKESYYVRRITRNSLFL